MDMHLADLATNGEVMARSVFDTDDEDGRLLFFLGQLVKRMGAQLTLEPVDEALPPLEIQWLRDEAQAIASFVCGGRLLMTVVLVTSPFDPKRLARPLLALQKAIVWRLRGTPCEPAFHLRDLDVRPLAVTVGWDAPDAGTVKRMRLLARQLIAAFCRLDEVKEAVAALEVD